MSEYGLYQPSDDQIARMFEMTIDEYWKHAQEHSNSISTIIRRINEEQLQTGSTFSHFEKHGDGRIVAVFVKSEK